MNSKIDVIKAWVDESWSNPPASIKEAGEKYFSDDFQNIDQDGNVAANKDAYIGIGLASAASFTGFRAVISELQEVSDGVIVTNHFEGTHTSDLDLSAMGVGVIPASGKKIVWPDFKSKFTVEGDKITGIHEITGGFEAFLAPLGVKLSSQ
jgi:hypothetical protein